MRPDAEPGPQRPLAWASTLRDLGAARLSPRSALDVRLQRGVQTRQMPIAFDAAHARCDGQQRTGHPAMFLIRRPPAIHFVGHLPDLRQERLQTIGSLQADAQHVKQAQPMQRQRLGARSFSGRCGSGK